MVGGKLHRDGVAGLGEQTQREGDALAGTVAEDHLVRADAATAALEALRDHLPQPRVALGRSVPEQVGTVSRHHALQGAPEGVDRVEGRVRNQ